MRQSAQAESSESTARETLLIVARGWYVLLAAAVVLGGLGLAYSLTQKPQYASTATLYVTSGTDDNSNAAYSGGQAAQQRVSSYTKLVESDAVLDQALGSAGLSLSKESARSALSSKAPASTVLLTITAQEPNSQTAASLANAVARSMAAYVQRLETPAGGGQPLAKLTLITPATTSETPVSPRTVRNVLGGTVLGLILGMVGVIARARLNTRVRTANDVTRVAEAPVIGVIPVNKSSREGEPVDFANGGVPAAEAYRKLRTNMSFTSIDRPARTILVTSSAPIEGKTTTAINLAIALAEADRKVMLVDGDLRRPRVSKRMGVIGDVGLTNALRGDSDVEDLIQATNFSNLWVLAAGPQPPNPAELLGSERMGNVIKKLLGHFDTIIIDTPPVLPVTDALAASQFVDGLIMVSRAEKTKIGDLRNALGQINLGKLVVLGHVLTEAREISKSYAYYDLSKASRPSTRGEARPTSVEDLPKTGAIRHASGSGT